MQETQQFPTVERELFPSDRLYLVTVQVPVVDHLDARVLQQIEHDLTLFSMWAYDHDHPANRHKCQTGHCVGGWYVAIAGQAGQALYQALGGHYEAAAAIFKESCPGQPVPLMSAINCPPADWLDAHAEEVKAIEDSSGPFAYLSASQRIWDAYCLDLLRQRAAADPLPV